MPTLVHAFTSATGLLPTLSPPAVLLPSIYGYYKLSTATATPFAEKYSTDTRGKHTPSFFKPTDRGKFLGITECYDVILKEINETEPAMDIEGVAEAEDGEDVKVRDLTIAEFAMYHYILLCDQLYTTENDDEKYSSEPQVTPYTHVTSQYLPSPLLEHLATLLVVSEKLQGDSVKGIMDNAVSVPEYEPTAELSMLNVEGADVVDLPPPPPVDSTAAAVLTSATLHTITSLPVASLAAHLPPAATLSALKDNLHGSNILHYLVDDPSHLPSLTAVMMHVSSAPLLRGMVNSGDLNGTTPFLASLSSGNMQTGLLLSTYARVGVRDGDGEGWRDYLEGEEGGALWKMCETIEREDGEVTK